VHFLHTLTRIRYRERWRVIEELRSDPDLHATIEKMLSQKAKREQKRAAAKR
jgi:hypothetical protein